MKSVEEIYQPLFGIPCWNVKLGHGSFLTFEFGDPHLVIQEPKTAPASTSGEFEKRRITLRGDWHLWIYCCDWRIFQHKTLLAHSENERSQMIAAAKELDGQALKQIHLHPETGATIFEFDLGGQLRTSPYRHPLEENEEQWFLFDPINYVLTLRADRKYSYRAGNSHDVQVWQNVSSA